MKGYTNKISIKIMACLSLQIMLFIAGRFVNPIYEGLGAMFFGLIVVMVLWYGGKVTYYIDETRIERKYFFKRMFAWDDVREVIIGDWYIRITSKFGSSMIIAKKKRQEDSFQSVKEDIISNVSDDMIKNDEDGSIEGLKLKAGVLVMFIAFILQAIIIVRSFVMNLILTVVMDKGEPYMLMILSLLFSAGAIVWLVFILININKRKASAMLHIKLFALYNVIAMTLSNFYVQKIFFESEFMFVLSVVVNVLYLLCIAGTYIFYVAESERVKHYFVK